MEFNHYSVMLNECIEGLNIKEDGLYVDCTAGGGGHSEEIAKRLCPEKGGKLIAIDQDADAIAAVRARLAPYGEAVMIVRDNFSNITDILTRTVKDRKPNGVIIDLGISSYQIDTAERGFSYMQDAPLDMRMNQDASLSAYEVVNEYSEGELIRVLRDWGEERFASRIARAILKEREAAPIKTTLALASIVKDVIPASSVERGSHPAKRSFQAIRIEVNGELAIIPPTVMRLTGALNEGGRLVILTFHSLEDRAVKQAMATECKGCTCPPDFPICVCGKKPRLRLITKKPLLPSARELQENSRSHSAKLRIAERLPLQSASPT